VIQQKPPSCSRAVFATRAFPKLIFRLSARRPRNKNLVVRYRGTGVQPPVVLLAHLDVVEAKREDWSLDPFKLTERDGFFYGRGTSTTRTALSRGARRC